jgi:hypothetical protein
VALNTTPRTWVSGETVTAAEMNTEIRDAFTGVQAAWTVYTTTTTNITLGNGTLDARYTRFGQTVIMQVRFTFGSTSAITGRPSFTMPTSTRSALWAMNCTAFDTSAGAWFPLQGVCSSGSAVTVFADPATAGAALRDVTSTVPMTWASGDILTVIGLYEAA